jgi:hypothetical protein
MWCRIGQDRPGRCSAVQYSTVQCKAVPDGVPQCVLLHQSALHTAHAVLRYREERRESGVRGEESREWIKRGGRQAGIRRGSGVEEWRGEGAVSLLESEKGGIYGEREKG